MNFYQKVATAALTASMFLSPISGSLVSGVFAEENEDVSKKENLPGMEKKIIVNGEEVSRTDQIPVGDTAQFTLTSNVPGNLFDYMDNFEETNGKITVTGQYFLTFHDDIQGEWTLGDNLEVTIGGEKLDEKYYTLESDEEDDECDLHVTIELIQLYNDGVITNEDIYNAVPIVVSYEATLSSEAKAAAHANTAWVTYDGETSSFSTAIADVFGIQVIKKDNADDTNYLAGAVFELKDGTDDNAKIIATLTTGEDGTATVEGLMPGEYYLYETKAPEGYVRATDPILVTITLDDAGENHIVEKDVLNAQAPSTGGAGTVMFTIAGTALLAGSAIVLTVSRKKKEQE